MFQCANKCESSTKILFFFWFAGANYFILDKQERDNINLSLVCRGVTELVQRKSCAVADKLNGSLVLGEIGEDVER